MDFTKPDIAVVALVAILVVKEAISFLWPLLRPKEPVPRVCPMGGESLQKEVAAIRDGVARYAVHISEIARIANTLLEHDSKKFDLVRGILERTKDLWEWHNVSDPMTGGKLWYVPKQLQENMAALLQVSHQQTETMKDLDRTMKAFLTSQQELLRRMGADK